MAYLVLFFIGLAIMFAGAFKLLCEALKYKKAAEHNEKLHEFWYDKWKQEVQRNIDADDNLAALEEGTKEIEENYQQELLTEYDKVSDLCNIVGALEQIRLDHQVFCLPILGEQILDENEEGDTPVYDSVVFEHIG